MGAIKPWHVIVIVLFVIIPLVIIAAVAVLVVALVRRSRGVPAGTEDGRSAGASMPFGAGAAAEDPRTILDLRLARGEITPEEHTRLRRAIESGPSPQDRTP